MFSDLIVDLLVLLISTVAIWPFLNFFFFSVSFNITVKKEKNDSIPKINGKIKPPDWDSSRWSMSLLHFTVFLYEFNLISFLWFYCNLFFLFSFYFRWVDLYKKFVANFTLNLCKNFSNRERCRLIFCYRRVITRLKKKLSHDWVKHLTWKRYYK